MMSLIDAVIQTAQAVEEFSSLGIYSNPPPKTLDEFEFRNYQFERSNLSKHNPITDAVLGARIKDLEIFDNALDEYDDYLKETVSTSNKSTLDALGSIKAYSSAFGHSQSDQLNGLLTAFETIFDTAKNRQGINKLITIMDQIADFVAALNKNDLSDANMLAQLEKNHTELLGRLGELIKRRASDVKVELGSDIKAKIDDTQVAIDSSIDIDDDYATDEDVDLPDVDLGYEPDPQGQLPPMKVKIGNQTIDVANPKAVIVRWVDTTTRLQKEENRMFTVKKGEIYFGDKHVEVIKVGENLNECELKVPDIGIISMGLEPSISKKSQVIVNSKSLSEDVVLGKIPKDSDAAIKETLSNDSAVEFILAAYGVANARINENTNSLNVWKHIRSKKTEPQPSPDATHGTGLQKNNRYSRSALETRARILIGQIEAGNDSARLTHELTGIIKQLDHYSD